MLVALAGLTSFAHLEGSGGRGENQESEGPISRVHAIDRSLNRRSHGEIEIIGLAWIQWRTKHIGQVTFKVDTEPSKDTGTRVCHTVGVKRIDCFTTDYHLWNSQSVCRFQIKLTFISYRPFYFILFYMFRQWPPDYSETQLAQLQLMMIDHFFLKGRTANGGCKTNRKQEDNIFLLLFRVCCCATDKNKSVVDCLGLVICGSRDIRRFLFQPLRTNRRPSVYVKHIARMFMSQIAVFLVALIGCTNLVQAGKCSDHLLMLSADGWSDGDESASQYGKAYRIFLSSKELYTSMPCVGIVLLIYKSNLTGKVGSLFNAPSPFCSREK